MGINLDKVIDFNAATIVRLELSPDVNTIPDQVVVFFGRTPDSDVLADLNEGLTVCKKYLLYGYSQKTNRFFFPLDLGINKFAFAEEVAKCLEEHGIKVERKIEASSRAKDCSSFDEVKHETFRSL